MQDFPELLTGGERQLAFFPDLLDGTEQGAGLLRIASIDPDDEIDRESCSRHDAPPFHKPDGNLEMFTSIF